MELALAVAFVLLLSSLFFVVNSEVKEYLGALIREQVGYLIDYNRNMETLRMEVDNLGEIKKDVQYSLDEVVNSGRRIGDAIESWLKAVDRINEEVRFLEEEAKVNKQWLGGWCPDMISRYSLSLGAKKKTQDVIGLQKYKMMLITGDFESRILIMEAIMAALKDDNINAIGICGLGGIGKTTMAQKIHVRVKMEKLFDVVVMIVVTQSPDLEKLQYEIADRLGLRFIEQSFAGRADRLRARLTDVARVLVILDDVWERLDLEAVGIPFGGDCKGCKVMITSRSQDVCHHMRTHMNFTIGVLSESESWNLFKEKAGNSVESPVLSSIAKEVLKECGGLPMAIATVGAALKGKNKLEWRDALLQLKMSAPENIYGMNHVYLSIVLSYDFLESQELKSCLLLCCLFEEDAEIPVEDLVKYGMGLGLFKGVHALAHVRNRVYTLVYKLRSCFLLLDGYKEESVKVHNVVRDVIRFKAAEGRELFMFGDGRELKQWPTKGLDPQYSLVSLISNSNKNHDLPDRLDCPKLELLLLRCMDDSQEAANILSEEMKELKVLQMWSIKFPSPPHSLSFLTKLRTLCLHDCKLENISAIGELKELTILCFSKSSIKELPQEIGKLTHLRLLDLTSCYLKRVSPGVISSLFQLEELYLRNSGLRWVVEGEGKEKNEVNLAELLSLSNLIALETHLATAKFPRGINILFEKLERFQISISPNEIQWGHENRFRNELILKHDTKIPVDSGIDVLVKKTETLYLQLKGMKNVLNDLSRKSLVQLKSLKLESCEGLEYLIDTVDLVSHGICFPILESLEIRFVQNLKMICHGQLSEGSFRKLRHIEVEYCDILENFFSQSVARGLVQLEVLKIRCCRMIEEIVARERGEHVEVTNKIKFPELRELTLEDLQSFIGFCKKMDEVEFPQLSTLFLKDLPKFRSFCLNSLASEGDHVTTAQHLFNEKVKSLCELRYMGVFCCQKLLNVFSSNLVQSLQNLEELEVQECDQLEVVFDFEGLNIEEGHAALVLTCLKKLELRLLPSLTYLWKKAPQEIQGFQNLQSLVVVDCWKLKYIFTPSIAKLLVKLENLQISNCAIVEIVGNDQEGSEENEEETKIIVFPKVKHLDLGNLPDLMSFGPKTYTFKWPVLKELSLRNANVKVFSPAILGAQKQRTINVRSHGEVQKQQITFPSLEVLQLEDEDNVEWILNGLQPAGKLREIRVFQCNNLSNAVPLNFLSSFQSLSILRVRRCKSLRNLFSPCMVKSVEQLQQLEIIECEMMTEIVAEDEGEGDEKAMDKIEFPQLRHLTLRHLPNLVSFFPKVNTTALNPKAIDEDSGEILPESNLHTQIQHLFNEKVVFPSLEELELTCVSKINEIWCKMDHNGTIGFQNLESLSVIGCGNLRNVFYPSMARRLVHLEYLFISNCKMMEEIVVNGEDEEEDRADKIVIPQLGKLKLFYLPSLTSFCQGLYCFDLPSLMHVSICQCPKMMTFSLDSPFTPKLQKVVEIYTNKSFWMGDLNKTIQQLFARKFTFPGATELRLSHNDDVELILHSLQPDGSLCKLREMHVQECNKLLQVVPSNLLPSLGNLEEITVLSCASLVEVFEVEGLNVEERDIVLLSKLEKLHLKDLTELTHLFNEKVLFPRLEKLILFQGLKSVRVELCGKLRNLFYPLMARGLVCLEELLIEHCDMMEEIISKGEEEEEERMNTIMVIPRLKCLELYHLPNLVSFCQGRYDLNWPSLEDVFVFDCPKMKTFSSGFLSTNWLNQVHNYKRLGMERDIRQSSSMGDLNKTIQQPFQRKELEVNQEIVQREHFDNNGSDNEEDVF